MVPDPRKGQDPRRFPTWQIQSISQHLPWTNDSFQIQRSIAEHVSMHADTHEPNWFNVLGSDDPVELKAEDPDAVIQKRRRISG